MHAENNADRQTVSAGSTLNNEDFSVENREQTTASRTATQTEESRMTESHASNEKNAAVPADGNNEQSQYEAVAAPAENQYEDLNIVTKATTAGSNKNDRLNLVRTSSIQYLEGPKLYALMASLTLIFFLVMLDVSIVATV